MSRTPVRPESDLGQGHIRTSQSDLRTPALAGSDWGRMKPIFTTPKSKSASGQTQPPKEPPHDPPQPAHPEANVTPADRARQILTDATTLVALIDPALTALDLGRAGWPEHTPGASPASSAGTRECPRQDCANTSPCPDHDPDGDITLTATERLAGQPDKAAQDLDTLTDSLKAAARHLTKATRIAHRWGLTAVTDTQVKAGLAVITRTELQKRIDDIWCTNCGRWGTRNVKLEGKTECDFCGEFRRDYNRPAPEQLLRIFAYRRVTVQDKERILDNIDPGWRKKLKKGKAA